MPEGLWLLQYAFQEVQTDTIFQKSCMIENLEAQLAQVCLFSPITVHPL